MNKESLIIFKKTLSFEISDSDLVELLDLQKQTFEKWHEIRWFGISFENYDESLRYFYQQKYGKTPRFKRWVDRWFGRPMKRYGV